MGHIRERNHRIGVAALALALLLAVPSPAVANRTCSDYFHRHYHGSLHFYNLYEVYDINPSGTGEWTYWWDSYWDYYQWDYYHSYYGSLYCA